MLTDIFIKRPVFTICLNLIILIAGYQAVNHLTTRQFPKSDLAVVKVTTTYVGADAELIRGFVTTPLEKAIASADGIDYISSSSAKNLSTIEAHLKLNYDINAALTQVQSKINQVRNDLPPEAEVPVTNVETTDSQIASMYLGFYSDKLKPNQITDYLLRVVQPRLSSISGVERADILGARTFAVRVWLKPEQMAGYNIAPHEVRQALVANNYLSALGSTKGSLVIYNLSSNADLTKIEEFKNLVIKKSDNSLIRLKDVADIEMGAENYDEEVRFGGKTATFIGVWVLPNANSLEVIQNVRKAFPDIEKTLPSGLSLGVPYDSTKYIKASIDEVLKTLTETVFIVIIVIFLFIGSLRAVLVPVVAIPLSLMGAVVIMYFLGFTLNLLTLLAIVLSVGLVVDDAIVMLENIERHIREGITPFKAAIAAARELMAPVIAMTITLVAVYAPIGIQGGLTGVLFREFAFTLAGAVLVSGFVAITLSPMMSSKLIKKSDKKNNFQLKTDAYFEKLREKYLKTLSSLIANKKTILTASFLLAVFAVPLYMFSRKELAPREDQGVVFAIVQAAPNSSVDQTSVYTKALFQQFLTFPEYEVAFQLTGATFGFSGFVTKPWSERKRTTLQMLPEAFQKFGSIPGIRAIATTPAPLPGGSTFPVEFVVSSTDDPIKLYDYGQQLVQAAFASGHFMFADTDLKFDLPEVKLNLQRDKIAFQGLNLENIVQDVATLTGGNYVNRFNLEGRSYKVIPQLERKARLYPEQLESAYISAGSNQLVSLKSLADFEHKVQARELKKFQQLNSVTIQGANHPGATLDQALSALEQKAAEILPKNYQVNYAGESRQLRKEGSTFLQTFVFAMIFIYLVLAAQFESFRDPFIILLGSVPLAIFSALIFAFLGFTTINIYSQVGLVTLVGLIAKNGILIVEFANNLREQGYDKIQAVTEACNKRLRPILMTSLATVTGHFPLILASGAGAAARNSIGIMLVAGMFIGTFFTLFVVPLIYLQFSGRRTSMPQA